MARARYVFCNRYRILRGCLLLETRNSFHKQREREREVPREVLTLNFFERDEKLFTNYKRESKEERKRNCWRLGRRIIRKLLKERIYVFSKGKPRCYVDFSLAGTSFFRMHYGIIRAPRRTNLPERNCSPSSTLVPSSCQARLIKFLWRSFLRGTTHYE